MFPLPSSLALIPAYKEVFKQITQKLQCNIFERECRAMEELEEVDVLLLIYCHRWCDVFGTERGVASANYVF